MTPSSPSPLPSLLEEGAKTDSVDSVSASAQTVPGEAPKQCRYTNEPGGACWRQGKAVELCGCHGYSDALVRAASCLTCAANHYCPERNPVPADMLALLRDPRFTMTGGSEFALEIISALNGAADTTSPNERAAFEAWHIGRFGRAYTEWVEAKGGYAWDLTEELWKAWQAARASLSEYAQSKQEPELTAGYTGSACVGDRTYGKVTLCYRSVAKAMSAHEYMLATYLDPDVPAAVSQSKQATPPEQENRDA
jgi:hypothetical protein